MNSLHFISRLGVIGVFMLSGIVSTTITHAASTSTTVAYQYAELNNCVIPAGGSTCTATLVVYAPSGMTYTVQNLTRGITSSNIITPNNFTLYNGGYAYVLKDTLLSDAANRLTYGENNLTLTVPGTTTATFKAVGSGLCASGLIWNGQTCSTTTFPPPDTTTAACILSSSPSVSLYENGSYILSSLTSSHMTLGWRSRSNCLVACDDAIKSFPGKRMNCFWNTTIIKEYGISDPTVNPTITATNCTIAAGKSTCVSTVTMTPTPQKYYNLENTTRGLTMTNAFRPGISTISTSTLGEQASNYLTNGANTLNVRDGTLIVARAFPTGTCATGTTWNGQMCAENVPVYIDFQVNNCTIPAGKSTCHTAVFVGGPTGRTYTLENVTRTITSTNIITPNNYSTSLGKYFLDPAKTINFGDTANALKYGMNYLKLKSGTTDGLVINTIGSATADASCATGSTWNGQICAANPPPTAPLTIACSKPSYTVGEAISCKITGGMGVKTCWQTGTTSTTEKNCVDYGWIPSANGIDLTYSGIVSTATIGTYTLYTKDSGGKIATTQVSYTQPTPVAPIIQATNCTIPAGKSTCVSTVTMIPVPAIFYSLKNTTRGLTMTNAFRPGVSTISTSVLGEQASNYLTNGTNILVARGGNVIARTQATATCAIGSTWNGQMCVTTKSPPITCTLEVRYCDDQSVMPRDPNSCEWLPGQCPLAYPVTSIMLTNIVVNDDPMAYAGDPITISSSDTLSLKGMTRPGGMLYFSREGQSTYESVGASSTTGEWELRKIWSPAGASIVIPGEYTYKITGLPPGTQSSFYSPEVLVKIKVLSPPTNTNNVLFSAKNCIIPVGKSTCASTVSVTSTRYKGTTGGRMFDMRNATRNLTTSNLFTPSNTTLNPDGYPVYTVGESILGDAANYSTHGANDLILIEGGADVAKTTMTATCATGSAWNGKICASTIVPPTQSGGIITTSGALVARMTNCIIPEGRSTCPATVLIFAQSGKTFSVNNITRGVSSLDLIKPIHFRILQGREVYAYRGINSPNFANNLTFGANTLTITEKGLVTIASTLKATARCSTDKKWDGTKCISPVPSVFSIKTYQTALSEKTVNGGVITFNPVEDKTLLLKGVGPYGTIEVLEGPEGRSLAKANSTDTTGKWQITIPSSVLSSQRTTTLMIWDGKNTSTQVRVQITNPTYQVPGTLGSTQLGDLTTVLVDLN